MTGSDESHPLSEFEFSRKIEEVRCALRGYIFSLLLDWTGTDEVFQDTIIFLWEKRLDYIPGSEFRAWAFKTAYFKILAKRRDQKRGKWVYYSDEMFEQIAVQVESRSDRAEARLQSLRACLALLPAGELELLRIKYLARGELTVHALKTAQSPNKLHKTLSRIRLRLKNCILKRLNESK